MCKSFIQFGHPKKYFQSNFSAKSIQKEEKHEYTEKLSTQPETKKM